MAKLKNRFIGQKEGWHLELDGKDLGDFRVAVISDMTEGDPIIGNMTAKQHLRKGFYVQKHSYLQEHQWFPWGDAKSVLENPNERFYTHVVAGVADKKVKHGFRGAGFSVVDRAQFSDGESYAKMFYIPTALKDEKKGLDFSNANVVKGNGQKESLEQLIFRESLNHIKGRNLLTVFDAPEAELQSLTKYNFRALAPQFDVPDLKSKTSKEFSQVADKVHMVVRAPEDERAKLYEHGVELGKAFQLFNGYLREGYIDEYANVRGAKEFRNRRIETAMQMYFDGIKKLVGSAVVVNNQYVVPYKGVAIPGAIPVNSKDKDKLIMQYTKLGEEAVQQYKMHFPAKV